MEASVSLFNGDRLQVKARRHALGLWPGVGGAQLDLDLEIARHVVVAADTKPPGGDHSVAPAEERLRIVGAVFLSVRVPQQDRQYLCRVESPDLVTAVSTMAGFGMRGFITDHQMRVIEELGAGAEAFWLTVALQVQQVVGRPPRLHQATGDLSIDVQSGEWMRELAKIQHGAFLEVQVPMDSGTDYVVAVGELARAGKLLAANEIDSAMSAARKALETVRKAEKTSAIARQVIKREKENPGPNIEHKRTAPERFAFLAEELYRNLSGSTHREEGTRGYEYSRAEAKMMIASTAGALAQLADRRRRG